MSEKYALAPEFREMPSFGLPANRWLLRAFNALASRQRKGYAWPDDIEVKTHTVASRDGYGVPVFEIATRDLEGDAPALVNFHGGAFCMTYMKGHLDYSARYSRDARCRVFLTDYRLSTRAPFPAPHDDCYATLSWVHENAGTLGVDRSRVALIGDSAGGALAAGVAQEALDRGENPICAQILIYPVTDHESKTESATNFTDTPMWRRSSNLSLWKVYLRGSSTNPPPPYAAPLHRESFAGLPPAVVEVAEFDPLRDEGLLYAEALKAAGVPTEVHVVKGAPHGYDLVDDSPTAAVIYKERMAAIQRFFARS